MYTAVGTDLVVRCPARDAAASVVGAAVPLLQLHMFDEYRAGIITVPGSVQKLDELILDLAKLVQGTQTCPPCIMASLIRSALRIPAQRLAGKCTHARTHGAAYIAECRVVCCAGATAAGAGCGEHGTLQP